MNNYKLAVIGVGNMAKAIIGGIQKSDVAVSKIFLFDKNPEQYKELKTGRCPYLYSETIENAVSSADCVLLAVKPQNYTEVLDVIAKVEGSSSKLYITIGAGITSQSVADALGGADVIRVLPNLPMTIGMGVSVICKNDTIAQEKFYFVCSLFNSAGTSLLIDECEMNRIIGVTSSSPAYVFKFIDAVYQGALAQGLYYDNLLDAVCDVFIGAAQLLKQSGESAQTLISRVTSKGGTTEQAMRVLNENDIEGIVTEAMVACTRRADELGNTK